MIVIFIMLVESALAVLFSCQDRGKRVSLKYDGTDDGSIISFNVVDPLPVTGRRALVIPSRQPRGILHRTIRQMVAETSAVNPLSLSNRTGFTAERRLYLFSGEIFKCAKVCNPISPAF